MRARGGVISKAVAIATARALIQRHPEFNLSHINLEDSSWNRSLFQRVGFVRRQATTGKVAISEEVRKEIEKDYLHSIVAKIENNKIHPSLVLNLDQTPSKFVPGCNKTLAPQGSKSVSIKGATDKRTITVTFTISLEGEFLPMQIIYGGKTKKSIPPVMFPKGFLVTANEKYYSNEEESIKMIEQIIIPYIERQKEILNAAPNQPALLIYDVFRGKQLTEF